MICGPWVSGRFVGCYDQSTESGHGWPSTSRPWMGGFVSNKISPLGGIPYMYQMFIIVYPCFIIFRTSHFFRSTFWILQNHQRTEQASQPMVPEVVKDRWVGSGPLWRPSWNSLCWFSWSALPARKPRHFGGTFTESLWIDVIGCVWLCSLFIIRYSVSFGWILIMDVS